MSNIPVAEAKEVLESARLEGLDLIAKSTSYDDPLQPSETIPVHTEGSAAVAPEVKTMDEKTKSVQVHGTVAATEQLPEQIVPRKSSPTQKLPEQISRRRSSQAQKLETLAGKHDGALWIKDERQAQDDDLRQDSGSISNDSAVHIAREDDDENVQDEPAYDNNQDVFSDYETDDASSFYSTLRSGATDYFWENGRRYHAHEGGRYMLPNDETELDREDMKHHEWMLITECRLHLAPIGTNPQRILDIGTGTGIWAMQVAELYPSAEVIGTDISPVQPKWVPPNLTFEIDDLEAEWLYRPGTYDLINCRFMFIAIKNWPAMLAQAYRTLKPGGYVELTELDVNPQATNLEALQPTQLLTWLNLAGQAMARRGFTMRIAQMFKDMLIDAGFVDVVETKFDVPWGTWPRDRMQKTIGFWHLEQFKQGLEGIAMGMLTRGMGWSAEEVQVFLVAIRAELNDKNFHILDHAYVVYGRKPFPGEGHTLKDPQTTAPP